MKKSIMYYFSGLSSEKEALGMLEFAKSWFYSSFKKDEWTVDTGVENGPFGWRASLEAFYNGVQQ